MSMHYKQLEPETAQPTSKPKVGKCGFFITSIVFSVLVLIVLILVFYWRKPEQEWSIDKGQLVKSFDEYIEKFGKGYKKDSEEYTVRLAHFRESLKEIDRLNRESQGLDNLGATYGLTRFSDLNKDEFAKMFLSGLAPTDRIADVEELGSVELNHIIEPEGPGNERGESEVDKDWHQEHEWFIEEDPLVKSFDEYITNFENGYKKDSNEYKVRLGHFKESLKEIDRLNRESQGPEHLRARYGPTKFSDLHKEEFAIMFLSGLTPTNHFSDAEEPTRKAMEEWDGIKGDDLPKENDWQQEHEWFIEEDLLVKSFDEYIKNFEKGYKKDSNEYKVRLGHFKESLKEIDRLNRESQGPEHLRARYGPTKFSDLHKEEFANMFLSGLTPTNHFSDAEQPTRKAMEEWDGIKDDDLPKQKDWRREGAVGPIEDQGACGGCWAFSTVGVIESFVAIHLNQSIPKLSIQQVLDCVEGLNAKCSGGDPGYSMKYMYRRDFVIVPESEYPMTLRNETCKDVKSDGYVLTAALIDRYVGKEIEMKRLLAKNGPLAVNVNSFTWQYYVGGIIQNNCGGDKESELNHAVQIVGYNEAAEVPYYIVRNSWGSTWNDLAGYLHVAMYRNECGLAFRVATPTAACRANAAGDGDKESELNHAVQIVGYNEAAEVPYYIVRNSWGSTWNDLAGYLHVAIVKPHNGDKESELNHAVQIVGYNEAAEVPYYIVRNSWASTWNDLAGYLHVAMYRNECGLAFRVATPTAVCRANVAGNGDKESELNHAVQIVGYNEAGEVPYYIVRNSWGSTWNDLAGYLHVAMYRNECGLAFRVATPTAVCRANAAGKCVP